MPTAGPGDPKPLTNSAMKFWCSGGYGCYFGLCFAVIMTMWASSVFGHVSPCVCVSIIIFECKINKHRAQSYQKWN